MAESAASLRGRSSQAFDSSGNAESTDAHRHNGGTADSSPGNGQQLPPLSESWREQPLADDEKTKVHIILRACRDRDFDELRALASSEGGLVEDEVRRTAWPILLGSHKDQPAANIEGWGSLPKHRDEDQVHLDVNRSFVYYPKDESDQRKDERKDELLALISAVLRIHPYLHYFQGFHDIAQVLLLVLGHRCSVPAVSRLSVLRIRDFMLPTMAGTEAHLHLFKYVLYAVDHELAQHLQQVEPFFALAATLTLYAHEIEEYGDIARLFDFLLANEATMPLYLYAAIVTSRRKELLEFEPEEPEMLHAILSKLPKPLDIESLIFRASEIFTLHPPERLPGRAWSRVSHNSVLKTTHVDPHQLAQQDLHDGKRWFEKYSAELKRADTWKRQKMQLRAYARRNSRPAAYTLAAVVVGLAAVLLRNNGWRLSYEPCTPILMGLGERIASSLRYALRPAAP